MANKVEAMKTEAKSDGLNRFINVVVMLVLTAGSIAMVLPSVASQSGRLFIDDRNLPPFFLGLIAVAVLFNIYLFSQKMVDRRSQRNQRALPLVDPLTQLLSNALGVGDRSEHASGHLG